MDIEVCVDITLISDNILYSIKIIILFIETYNLTKYVSARMV